MLRFGLRTFLVSTILVGSLIGISLRIWCLPYKVKRYYVNGSVAYECWKQRSLTGETKLLPGDICFYSNGMKSREVNHEKYYDPHGNPIEALTWRYWYLRDKGDGTFAETLRGGDGQPQPLAAIYDERP